MRHLKIGTGVLAGTLAILGGAASLAFAPKVNSGVEAGETLSAFQPHHVTGANKNSDTCPVCMYPQNPAVQVWINGDDEKNVRALVRNLEQETIANKAKKFKAFVVFINPQRQSAHVMNAKLAKIGAEEKLKNVALAYLLGPKDTAVTDYKINTAETVKNTVFVYRARKVATKFVNFTADAADLKALDAAISQVAK